MKHRISGIDSGSIAEEIGVPVGSELVSINGEDIVDVIDYEQLCANETLIIRLIAPDGEEFEAEIEKDEDEPLGLNFSDDLIGGIRSCKNHCIFCFIDQMARGGRSTLHVKDDDWRMSLIMGNYVTLTNVSDAEFERILKRKASPLYISVHTLNPELRRKMMGNPTAVLINERLKKLSEAGITVHCQIVLCPGINDGQELTDTLNGLCEMYPCVRSVAVVPVGLTKFRDKLFPLRTLTKDEAEKAIEQTERVAEKMLKLHGISIVYCADELYLLADKELPEYEYYEDFPQIENGVGLFRKLERECIEEISSFEPRKEPIVLDCITGVSIAAKLQELFDKLNVLNLFIKVHFVINHYFGETVTVAGLVCATDIIEQLSSKFESDTIIIPDNMLRDGDDVFLDSVSLKELSGILGKRIVPVCHADGAIMLSELMNIKK